MKQLEPTIHRCKKVEPRKSEEKFKSEDTPGMGVQLLTNATL